MTVVYENILRIILMSILLGCSAFFSGAETAFFSLSRRQIHLLRQSRRRRRPRFTTLQTLQGLENLVLLLVRDPERLLGSLLFANCAVNICFFSLATILSVSFGAAFGPTAAALTAALTLAVLVLFGEMLPKSLAYANSRSFALAAAIPSFIVVRILSPIHFVFNFLIVEPVLRLLLGPAKIPKPINPAELKLLIESSRQKGLITPDENQLLAAVVEFGFLKVRHLTTPRVDMAACDVNTPSPQARRLMAGRNLTKMPVYSRTIDNIIGLVHLRDLLLQPKVPLDKLTRKANFVPEQKTVESLLEYFRKSGTDTAIVVDEYGGIAGSVCVEDIVAELLGPLEPARTAEPVQQIGPMTYRLEGSLPIHDWADAFGIDAEQTRLSTIGGLVTDLLGRIPRAGDTAYLKNLKFTVETMRKNRIETVILSFEAISDSTSQASSEEKGPNQ